jgi:hypothetical protein
VATHSLELHRLVTLVYVTTSILDGIILDRFIY